MSLSNLMSGFIGAVLGAITTVYLQRRAERTKEKEKTRFQVYLKLLDCLNPLFWMSCAETPSSMPGRSTIPKFEHERQFKLMSLRVSDELRKIEDLAQMEKILRVLFSEKFESAADRYEELDRVVEELGEACNAQFSQVMRKIGEENLHLTAAKFETELAENGRKVEERLKERLSKDGNEGPDEI